MIKHAELINTFVGIAVAAICLTVIALFMNQKVLVAIAAACMIVAAICINRLATGKR